MDGEAGYGEVRRGDCSGLKRGALAVGWGWKGAAQGPDWDIELAPGLLRFTRSGSCQGAIKLWLLTHKAGWAWWSCISSR